MEMSVLNNANQTTVNANGIFDMVSGQQTQQATHSQMSAGQININQAHLYRNHQQQQHQGYRYLGNQRISQHRELPVDVPDSFVAVTKQAPRYPPPKPHRQVSPSMTVTHTTANIPYNSGASLRSSIKLKQLEKSRQQNGNYPIGEMQPAVNQAFELNEDDQSSPQAIKSNQSMPDLCSIYNKLQKNLNGELTETPGDSKLVKLLSIYNAIMNIRNKQVGMPDHLTPGLARVTSQSNQKVTDLLQSFAFTMHNEEMSSDIMELLAIFCKHEFQGVSSAYDRIAQSFEFTKTYQSASMEPYSYQQSQMNCENTFYGLHPLSEGTVRTICINKHASQALGATIKNEDGCVVIGRIVCGGAAYNSGLLNEGDEILEVNGIQMRGKNINEVINILEEMRGTLTFTTISRNSKPVQRPHAEETIVKTFFDFDASNDRYIPCKELGLSFQRGEVLRIIDQSDSKWWQARKADCEGWDLARLIPSIDLLKELDKESTHEADVYFKRDKKNVVSKLFNFSKRPPPTRKKKHPNIFGPEEVLYYEEVIMYYPSKFEKRPIILIGPKMIGQREIRAKLLQDASGRFAGAVSHTSKPRAQHERDGIDFHFVSRTEFESDIKAGKFIECGQYQNHYYGTSLEAMKAVAQAKKICVHLVNITSLFNFRQGKAGSELKPFFVFVKPDMGYPEKLRNIVASFSPPKSNIEENVEAIKAEVELIERQYLPYFDYVLTVSDVESAYENLLARINKVETEPQWIPISWPSNPRQTD